MCSINKCTTQTTFRSFIKLINKQANCLERDTIWWFQPFHFFSDILWSDPGHLRAVHIPERGIRQIVRAVHSPAHFCYFCFRLPDGRPLVLVKSGMAKTRIRFAFLKYKMKFTFFLCRRLVVKFEFFYVLVKLLSRLEMNISNA